MGARWPAADKIGIWGVSGANQHQTIPGAVGEGAKSAQKSKSTIMRGSLDFKSCHAQGKTCLALGDSHHALPNQAEGFKGQT